jgi:hypothetical protein
MKGLRYIGSFQHENRFPTETPLNEVWDRISRFGTQSFLQKTCHPKDKGIDWDQYLSYAKVRVRQAVEFHDSAQVSSILTTPLLLYYSYLNLTRAFLAISRDIIPKPAHGLRLIKSDNLLDTKARLCKGTFTDYLKAEGIEYDSGSEISMADALGFVPEIAFDYKQLSKDRIYISTVAVEAFIRGEVRLKFQDFEGDFSTTWKIEYPELADSCELDKEANCVLIVRDGTATKDYEAIKTYLNDHLWPNLTLSTNPIWYTFRSNNKVIKLTRSAYYYVAMFILGSVVRYRPELLLEASSATSELTWILKRFVKLADRFYPQLKLMELYNSQIYFS